MLKGLNMAPVGAPASFGKETKWKVLNSLSFCRLARYLSCCGSTANQLINPKKKAVGRFAHAVPRRMRW